MLDRNVLRKEPDRVREAAASKGEPCPLDEWAGLDRDRRQLLQKLEDLRRERNELSEEVARAKRAGEDADDLIQRSRAVGEDISSYEDQLPDVEKRMEELELSFANLPDEDVPRGPDESANQEIRSWGEKPEFDFDPQPHWDLMGDALDQDASVRVAGANFLLFRGWAARLQRTLINWMMDYHDENGYQEIWPPFVALEESMVTTGQIPKLQHDMYRVEKEEFYLAPTAEVQLTNVYRGTIIPEDDLPLRVCAYTPCFRREAGSYGKETRGLNRVHQFEKVEIVCLEHPERSEDRLEEMLSQVERMLRLLEIPYRVMLLATGDLSFAAAKCYDLEIWSAGQEKWLEVSSVSNFRDFQARRGRIRFRPSEGGKTRFVHTLNGSGLALPRLISAIVENNQDREGGMRLPQVLADSMGTDRIDSPG
ncbi:serine--tRNA ligase [Candidatus Fermentibacteria bacterium]|nr:serine--tRNA ligase [Candidatus Fermentibacteria bacterium]